MNAPHPPPAGWYPDPSGRAPFRYWDGAQWTEHTNQGTPPSPSVGQAAPAAQAGFGGPYGGPYGGGAPVGMPAAARPATAGPLTAQSLMEDLKRLEGFAVMLAAGLLFVVFTFFSWVNLEASRQDLNTGQVLSGSDSSNAWDGKIAWMIRGYKVNLENLQKIEANLSVDGGTDMVVLLPVLLIAIGVAGAVRVGKPVNRGNEIALGASALLAVLMVAEVISLNGALEDTADIYTQYSVQFDGSVGFGMYVSTLAAFAMTYGAFRLFQGSRTTAPAGGPPTF